MRVTLFPVSLFALVIEISKKMFMQRFQGTLHMFIKWQQAQFDHVLRVRLFLSCVQDDPGRERVNRLALRRDRVSGEQQQHGRA